MKKGVVAAGLLAIFVLGLWSIAISDELLAGLIRDSLKESGITVETTELKKGLLFGFSARRIDLKKNGSDLLSIAGVEGTMNPAAIIFGRRAVHFRGSLDGGQAGKERGTIEGAVSLSGGTSARVNLRAGDIQYMPFLRSSGISGGGLLNGELSFERNRGEVRFDIDGARLAAGSFSGISVPLDSFRSAQGAMSINGSVIEISSFSLRGEGIYARVKGRISGSQIEMLLELMPDRAFENTNLIFTALSGYRLSPGYYAIPLKKAIE